METKLQKQSGFGKVSMVMRMLSSLLTTNGEKKDFLTTGDDKVKVPVLSNFFCPTISFQSSQGVVSSTFKLTSTVLLEEEYNEMLRTESGVIFYSGQRSMDLSEKRNSDCSFTSILCPCVRHLETFLSFPIFHKNKYWVFRTGAIY